MELSVRVRIPVATHGIFMSDKLKLIKTTTSYDVGENGKETVPRSFFDFVVNEKSLHSYFDDNMGNISPIGWGVDISPSDFDLGRYQEYELRRVEEYLNKKSLDYPGRILLYVCKVCGDIGCGAFTAELSETNSHYVWSNFYYENNYETPTEEQKKSYEDVGPFHFLKADYEGMFNELKINLAKNT